MSTEPANSADNLVAVLDRADALPGAAALRSRSYDLLRPAQGAVIADVGCGAGRAAAELHERGVRAIGVDSDEQMIAVAQTRWPDVEFHVGDAGALPFEDGTVDGYRADKMLHALADPSCAVAEACRVLRPGGHIVLLGQDWDTLVIDSDDADLTRTIVHARAETLPSPRAARSYRNLLLQGGFGDPSIEVHTAVFTKTAMLPMLVGLAESATAAGAVTRGQADAWIAEQTERGRADTLLLAVPLFVAAARRP